MAAQSLNIPLPRQTAAFVHATTSNRSPNPNASIQGLNETPPHPPPHKRSADKQVSPPLACEKGGCPGPGLAGGHLPYHGFAGRIADGPETKPPSMPAHLLATVINKSAYASFLRKVKHMLANDWHRFIFPPVICWLPRSASSPQNLLPTGGGCSFPACAALIISSLGVGGAVCLFVCLIISCSVVPSSFSVPRTPPPCSSACCYSWHPNQC